MTQSISSQVTALYSALRENTNTLLNYFFILYVFFLPIAGPSSNTFFIILILFLIRGEVFAHIKKALQNRVILSFTLVFLVSAVWMIGSDDISNGLVNVYRYKVLLLPVIFYSFLRPEFVAKALGAFMLGMMVSELVSYSVFFELITSPKHHGSPLDPSPFYHHTQYGLLLAFTAGLLLYRAIAYHDNKVARAIMFIFFITITINIFITGGRMGYILYAITMFSILLMHKTNIFKTILISLTVSVAVFSLAYQFSPAFNKRFNDTLRGLSKLDSEKRFESSFGSRLGMAYYSLPSIQENWLFGVGTGDHMQAMKEQVKKADKDLFLLRIGHLHNVHLTILLQFGLIGLLFWLNSFYQIIRYRQENDFLRTILTLSVIVLLFFAFFDNMFKAQMAIIFSTIVTIALVDLNGLKLNTMHFKKKEILFYLLGVPTMYLLGAVS